MYHAKKIRRNHPPLSFIIGFVFMAITLVVLVGVLYHLAFSPYGPQLLMPMKEKYFTPPKSLILTEAKKAAQLEIHRHFHNVVSLPLPPENLRPVCYICHSDFPHKKNKKVRSLMNMHTQWFVCETCHIKEEKGTKIIYKWYNPMNAHPKGPFFGTSYNPENGQIERVHDLISKIAPYYKTGDKIELAIQVQDAPMAKDFMRVRDQLTPEQRAGVKNKFHTDIKPKGYDCITCHAKDGILDFKKLGFSKKRAVDLQELNIRGMMTKYKTFYLPDLFK